VLGVRKDDYMSGSRSDLEDAIDNFVQQAQERTAKLGVAAIATSPQQITANVAITNLAGHRFPSGVGFRRAFIELLVRDSQGNVVWASGRTNNLGVIVDGSGEALPSEFLTEYQDPQGRTQQHYQPHYQIINAQDQVQIYEELTQNAEGKFTTNFVRRDDTIKDNRLLPIGWTRTGPDPSLNGRFLESTHAEGDAVNDSDYQNGQGTDRLAYQIVLPEGIDPTRCTVRATLYYQATPPYYLNDRFKGAPDGDATKRLYYVASNLDLTGTAVDNWKLPVATVSIPVTTGLLGSQPSAIISPAPQEQFQTAPVELKLRFARQAQITFWATLNDHDFTSKFASLGQGACGLPCEFAATVFPQDGLRRGRNRLRIVVSDENGSLVTLTRNFFVTGPKAVAGVDLRSQVGQTVTLDGSKSPSGFPLTYRWVLAHKPGGSNAALRNASSAMPSVVPDVKGRYVARLVVHDGHFESKPDRVTVWVNEPQDELKAEIRRTYVKAGPNGTTTQGFVQTNFQPRRHADAR
jgi:hypothetical protein